MGTHLSHTPLPERFFAQFEKRGEDECWPWSGHRTQSGNGYGQLKVGKERWQAHRYSYVFYRGSIAEGQVVCHECDNPVCVNPAHLFLGTQLDNMRDMHRKGRRVYARGPQKTICKRGHPFTEENLYFTRDGKRGCIVCRRIRDRNRK